MAVGRAVGRKDRLISFRVSQEEYLVLRSFCHENGIRNLSEFARSAVGEKVEDTMAQPGPASMAGSNDSGIGARDLNDTMLRLTDAVSRLSLLIEQRAETLNPTRPT